jgi:hypothetical protein
MFVLSPKEAKSLQRNNRAPVIISSLTGKIHSIGY